MAGTPSSTMPRESQAKFRDGTVWGFYKCPVGTGPAGSVFGEISFYRETRVTRLRGRHVAKRSCDPRVAYSEVKFQVRDLVRVVGNVAPFAPRGSVFGKIRFIEPQGSTGHRRLVPGAPAVVPHGRAKQSSGTGLCGDCRMVLWVPGLFEICKIAVCFLWLSLPGDYRVTDEALLAETT